MTVPCESKPDIKKLQGQQDEVKEGQNDMELRLRMQGEHIAQIKDAAFEMVSGFKEFATEMRSTVSEIKEKQIRDDMETQQQRKELDMLFADKRDVRDKVLPQVYLEIGAVATGSRESLKSFTDREFTPLLQRVSVIESNHTLEEGKQEGFFDSVKTWKTISVAISAFAAIAGSIWVFFSNVIGGK
jgi:hypothetical protein